MRVLLTEGDWESWFEVTRAETTRLVAVQQALVAAGFCPCPETVIGMSRSLLAETAASAKLRALADLWDGSPAGSVHAEPQWPSLDEPAFISALAGYRWLGGDGEDGASSRVCPRRRRQ